MRPGFAKALFDLHQAEECERSQDQNGSGHQRFDRVNYVFLTLTAAQKLDLRPRAAFSCK
ncbi:MAG: hypothetical protein DME21_09205 [Verrucomicrobia bacterium]|nr:MAG: hypothetical protein DME21_09205 [Verrucomicrobiota bacterium]